MDLKSYISSGIIEACLTGIASDEEVRQMEIMSEKHPEVKAEITKVQTLLENWASKQAIPPSENLKEKIWTRLHEENEAPGNSQKASTEQASPIPLNTGKQTIKLSRWKYYSAAAAVLLLMVSGYYCYVLYQKNAAFEQQIIGLQKQLLNNRKETQATIASYQQKLSGIVAGDIQRINLSGTPEHPDLNGVVLWNQTTEEVYLSLNQLPVPPKGMQYQLWAIVDGQPVNAGVYQSADTSDFVQKMNRVSAHTQMFAVTLEKEGGVDAPTLSAMYVAGKI